MWSALQGAAAGLQLVSKGESYQWNLEMDVTPGDLVHFMHKDVQTNKKNKYSISWLLLYVIAKLKSAVLALDARPNSDFSECGFRALASKSPPQGKL